MRIVSLCVVIVQFKALGSPQMGAKWPKKNMGTENEPQTLIFLNPHMVHFMPGPCARACPNC